MPSVEVNIPIIVIAGPTASGKSGLALALAEKLNGFWAEINIPIPFLSVTAIHLVSS